MQILHTGTRISPSTICETYKKINSHTLNVYPDKTEISLARKLGIIAINKDLLHRSKQIPQKPMHQMGTNYKHHISTPTIKKKKSNTDNENQSR